MDARNQQNRGDSVPHECFTNMNVTVEHCSCWIIGRLCHPPHLLIHRLTYPPYAPRLHSERSLRTPSEESCVLATSANFFDPALYTGGAIVSSAKRWDFRRVNHLEPRESWALNHFQVARGRIIFSGALALDKVGVSKMIIELKENGKPKAWFSALQDRARGDIGVEVPPENNSGIIICQSWAV